MSIDPLHVILCLCLGISLGKNYFQARTIKKFPDTNYRAFRLGGRWVASFLIGRIRDDGPVDTPLYAYDYLHGTAQAVTDEETTYGRYLDALEVQGMLDSQPTRHWNERGPAARLDAFIMWDYERHMRDQMRNRPSGEDTGGAG